MDSPLITIGLPTYNNEKTIVSCIKSILAQTFTNWNLIIINDGSTDRTYELIKNINDPRITIINDGLNKGLIYRLNQLVSLSKGKYIARMDGDDLMHPLRLEKQVQYLLDNPDIDVLDTGLISINDNGIPEATRRLTPIPSTFEQIVRSNPLTHPSVMGKKEWFQNNQYNDDFIRAEDFELWCRTFQHSKFSRVTEPLHFLREGNVSISNYVKTGKTVRHIYLKYAIASIGRTNTNILIVQSYLKSMLYYVFGFFSIQSILSRKRNQSLSLAEKKQFQDILLFVEATPIPLLPGT